VTRPAEDMLTRMRALLERLPARTPTVLLAGPGVVEELQRSFPRPNGRPDSLPFGITIRASDELEAGEWRLLDQDGAVMRQGRLAKTPEVGDTIQVAGADGAEREMRVVAVRPREVGRGIDVFAVHPDLLDPDFIGRQL